MNTEFHSHGKLLLTGEYVVLDGAKALALPTKFGQSLEVSEGKNGLISWESVNENGEIWFEGTFLIKKNREIENNKDDAVSVRLKTILDAANRTNPKFFPEKSGFKITSKLDFPQNWGLGSSSTLINNIANWFEIDAYELLGQTFGGSGYDIACAKTRHPLSYQLAEGTRIVSKEHFNPDFKDQLFFVHLNQKQNSREAIAHYKNQPKDRFFEAIKVITHITEAMIECNDIASFQKLMSEHERIISSLINIAPIKQQLFHDYPNSIKSLGGWGGDFILAVGNETEKDYFKRKGYSTILDFSDLFFEL